MVILKSKAVIILVTVILVTSIIGYFSHTSEDNDYDLPKSATSSVSTSDAKSEHLQKVQVLVDDIELFPKLFVSVYSKSLRPYITINIQEEITDIELKLDDSGSLLSDSFYGETEITDSGFIFLPSFDLSPQNHSLILSFKNKDGVVVQGEYAFTLYFYDDFSSKIDKTKWVVPKHRSPDWFSVQQGKMFIGPETDSNMSSLAFIKTLTGSISVDFELTPLGDNVSLVFYLWDSTQNQFVFGSDGNIKIYNFYKDGKNNDLTVAGKDTTFRKYTRYHVRIIRDDYIYKVYVKELGEENYVNPSGVDLEKVLEFIDEERRESIFGTRDQLGFSLWKRSGGVFIDNVYITGYSEGRGL